MAENTTDVYVSKNVANQDVPGLPSELTIQDTVGGRHTSPVVDFTTPNVGAYHVSTLTRAMLDEFVDKCPHSIVIENVVTDLSSSKDCNLDGPWSYRDSKTVVMTYILGDSREKRQISLCNLKHCGFCGPSRSGPFR